MTIKSERWPSGRRRSPAKGVCSKTASRVRIPLSPPDLVTPDLVRINFLTFFALGADFDTTVYRIITSNRADYSLKLRSGKFLEASVSIPRYLADSGLKPVLPPNRNRDRTTLDKLGIFYGNSLSYMDGHNAVDAPLSEQRWIEFGNAMKRFRSTDILSTITSSIPRETSSPKWR